MGFAHTRSRRYSRRCCRIVDERGSSVNPFQRLRVRARHPPAVNDLMSEMGQRATLTARRSFPAPDKRTISEPVGMSQTCHERKSASLSDHLIGTYASLRRLSQRRCLLLGVANVSVPFISKPHCMPTAPPLPNAGSGGLVADWNQRLRSDAMTAPASASSTQGVTVNWSTSAH